MSSIAFYTSKPTGAPISTEGKSLACAAHKRETCDACNVDLSFQNTVAAAFAADSDLPGPSEQLAAQIAATKDVGNRAFRDRKYPEAAEAYGNALDLSYSRPIWEPAGLVAEECSTLLSNRAAAYCELEMWEAAEVDARTCIQIRANWPKGWFRLGKAMLGLNRLREALEAFESAAKYDPNSADVRNALNSTRDRIMGVNQ